MADANILQGHIFQDDVAEDECIAASEALQSDSQKNNGEGLRNPLDSKAKQRRDKPKPAAHRVNILSILSYARFKLSYYFLFKTYPLNFNN